MRHDEFTSVIKDQMALCRLVLIEKANEYASVDRLHNFKIAAAIQDCSLRQALAGMLSKHTVSIYDMCASDEDYSMDKWNEKITDHLNYLLLLKAIVIEEKKNLSETSVSMDTSENKE